MKTVTALKEKYPHIKRIYVRAAYPQISDEYKEYILESYEETYFPEKIQGAGKASYVERNQEMINKSDFCIVYYDENYIPPLRKNSRRAMNDSHSKSGTAIAYNYAKRKEKKIFNVFDIMMQ